MMLAFEIFMMRCFVLVFLCQGAALYALRRGSDCVGNFLKGHQIFYLSLPILTGVLVESESGSPYN